MGTLGLPPSAIARVGDAQFEYVLAGSGGPAIVCINGSGGPLAGWHRVLPALAARSTVFAYNRPGVGRSSPPTVAQTADAMAGDLLRLLETVPVPPPWLLVGHSFGGLVANLFARLNPRQTRAVVLLEATAPQDVGAFGRHETRLQRALAALAARIAPLPPAHETHHAAASAAQVLQSPAFPPVPLVVVTGTRPAMAWATPAPLRALRAEHQRQLAALSPLGRQVLAQRSGHFPQFSEPALVVDAIAGLLAASV